MLYVIGKHLPLADCFPLNPRIDKKNWLLTKLVCFRMSKKVSYANVWNIKQCKAGRWVQWSDLWKGSECHSVSISIQSLYCLYLMFYTAKRLYSPSKMTIKCAHIKTTKMLLGLCYYKINTLLMRLLPH